MPAARQLDVNDPQPEEGDFPQRLRSLFASVPSTEGRRMSVSELCAVARDRGHDVSEAYVYQLLQGRKANPSYHVIAAIAAGFGVPASYFFDEQIRGRIDQQIQLLRLVADTPVKQLYFRSMDLDNDHLSDVLDYARQVRQRQGLPPLEDLDDVADPNAR